MQYSQYEEENHIIDYLNNYKPSLWKRFKGLFEKKRQPILLDIGGNDGTTHSNSLALILRGWDALVVDPTVMAVVNARINYQEMRRNVTVAPCAIGAVTENKTFWEFTQKYATSRYGYFSTFKYDEVPEEVKEFFIETLVDVMDYKTFCDTYNQHHFDFITIDTCGTELEILSQIDLSKTKLVCVAYTEETKEHIISSCEDYGLSKVIYTSPANIVIGR